MAKKFTDKAAEILSKGEPMALPFSKEEKVVIRTVAKRLAKAADPETVNLISSTNTALPAGNNEI